MCHVENYDRFNVCFAFAVLVTCHGVIGTWWRNTCTAEVLYLNSWGVRVMFRGFCFQGMYLKLFWSDLLETCKYKITFYSIITYVYIKSHVSFNKIIKIFLFELYKIIIDNIVFWEYEFTWWYIYILLNSK